MDANLIAGLVALVGILAIVMGVRLAGRASAAADARGLALGNHLPVRGVGPGRTHGHGRPSLPRQVSVTGLEAG